MVHETNRQRVRIRKLDLGYTTILREGLWDPFERAENKTTRRGSKES